MKLKYSSIPNLRANLNSLPMKGKAVLDCAKLTRKLNKHHRDFDDARAALAEKHFPGGNFNGASPEAKAAFNAEMQEVDCLVEIDGARGIPISCIDTERLEESHALAIAELTYFHLIVDPEVPASELFDPSKYEETAEDDFPTTPTES